MASFVREFVRDVATLRRPVTAASLVALAVTVLTPFGVDLSAEVATAVVAGVGTVFAYLESLAGRA